MSSNVILSIRNLRVSVRTDEGTARILDHVNLDLHRGEIMGIAGESGCGKSTLIRAILGILPRGGQAETGEILFKGKDLLRLSPQQMQREIRGSAIGFIPQDPYLALNPVFTVGAQLLEILRWHGLPEDPPTQRYSKQVRQRHKARLVELLKAAQVPDPERALDRYPHQFSGGQRQRLLIAGALACQPEIILADEPTTALDVTTQLQILKLLKELAKRFDVAVLLVTHDFGVIAQTCDNVSVLYAGQTSETARTEVIIDDPLHPYTQLLMRCHPDRSVDLVGIPGHVPSPLAPPSGCRFHPRCPKAMEICKEKRPPVIESIDHRHGVACVLYEGGLP